MKSDIPTGETVTGNVAKHLDSRFLNSTVLSGVLAESGKDFLSITIDRVEYLEKLKYENGSIDTEVLLLYFTGSDKPLKLCKTNVKRLIHQLGPMGEDWNGKKIGLCIEQDRRPDLGGKTGDCVRIKRKGL